MKTLPSTNPHGQGREGGGGGLSTIWTIWRGQTNLQYGFSKNYVCAVKAIMEKVQNFEDFSFKSLSLVH